MQVETLAEAGSYEDALSLCAMCKVRDSVSGGVLIAGSRLPSPKYQNVNVCGLGGGRCIVDIVRVCRGLRYRETPGPNAVRSLSYA